MTTDTKERLLDAVDQVIAEHGPSGVTLRRVGDIAGLSHTAAAHYFKDKPGLFTAYIVRAYDRVADRLETAIAVDDPRQAMLNAGEAYAQFAIEEPSAFGVMSRMELVRVDTPELWAGRERGFFALVAAVENYQLTGWALDREVLDLVATTWAFVHGFVDLWVGGPLWAPYDGRELNETLQELLGALIDSL